MQLFGQYVSPTKMSFELSQSQNGHHVNDAQLSLAFDDDERLLRGRAYMRPTLWDDIHTKLRPQNFDPSRLSHEFSQLQRSLEYDARLKRHYMSQSIAEPLGAVVDYYTSEGSRKMQQVNYAFERKYRANEFYMRDVHQALQRHYDDFRYTLCSLYSLPYE